MSQINTSERAMCAICHMFGIGADAYTEAWYEAGCTYAERNYPRTGRHLIRSTLYWQRWNKRWVEVACRFIEWNNPEKTLKDLCKLAADRNALMPKYRFYIDKYPVP